MSTTFWIYFFVSFETIATLSSAKTIIANLKPFVNNFFVLFWLQGLKSLSKSVIRTALTGGNLRATLWIMERICTAWIRFSVLPAAMLSDCFGRNPVLWKEQWKRDKNHTLLAICYFSADFSVNKSSVSSFCVAVGLRAIHLLLRVKIKMAEMESC